MNEVAIAMQKGGVGKTAMAINLAERIAARGHDVLLVDLDPQGSATEGVGCGAAYAAAAHLGDALDPEDSTRPADLVRPASGDTDFDLLPANRNLPEVLRNDRVVREVDLGVDRSIVRPLSDRYDWIVYDTPPSVGPLSRAAMAAAGRVILPLQLTEPSADALVRTVTEGIRPLGERLDEPVDVLAVVPNRVKGDNEERRVLRSLEESTFERTLPSFARTEHYRKSDSPGPGIRERVAFRRAHRDGVPLATYDPDCDMLRRLDELAEIAEFSWGPGAGSAT